ncbi:hypothetical protein H4R33_006352 [Dimargaris cristalligena]|nr:hypothetical protein H4R33_006352 [Dimargaris cristalligena]
MAIHSTYSTNPSYTSLEESPGSNVHVQDERYSDIGPDPDGDPSVHEPLTLSEKSHTRNSSKVYKWALVALGIVLLSSLVFLGHCMYQLRHLNTFVQQQQQASLAKESTAAQGRRREFPPIQAESLQFTELSRKRLAEVQDAIRHTWQGYAAVAFGYDEIGPVSNMPVNKWGGYGMTLIDSLDTLWIAGLDTEFKQAVEFIHTLSYDSVRKTNIPFFETVIRTLGGLLSAYELSHDRSCLLKALEMAGLLQPAFDTNTRLPAHAINPTTGHHSYANWAEHQMVLAEIGTIQLEYKKLSYYSLDPKFDRQALDAIEHLRIHKPSIPGLYPVLLDPRTGEYNSDIESVESMKKYLVKPVLFQPEKSYLASIRHGKTIETDVGHLSCFAPGMLALGAKVLNRPEDMEVAKSLIEGCMLMYSGTRTGLAPEAVHFATEKEYEYLKNYNPELAAQVEERGYYIGTPYNILRPETVESLFVLYRLTGDPKYQEYGWVIFKAFEKHCKTPYAFSALRDVDGDMPIEENWSNNMESFFMAETMKYLYLLFADPSTISLDEYVFNTEAHPLKLMLDLDQYDPTAV